MNDTAQTPVTEMTFEQAYAELMHVISLMEEGTLPLEQSVAMYERGRELAAHCDSLLDNAELRVEKLNAADDRLPF